MSTDYPHIASIRRFVLNIGPNKPLLIVLFGSVARRDFTETSDADVLVVFPEQCDWNLVYACSDGWVQPVVMSLEELRKRLIEGESLAHEIEQDGELIFGSHELWDELRGIARDARERLGMKRFPDRWSYSTAAEKG